MTVERKIALFGIDKLSFTKPAMPKTQEELVTSFLSHFHRDVIVRNEEEIRVIDIFESNDANDRVLTGDQINAAGIDNAQDGLLGKILRISYKYKPSEASYDRSA